MCANTRWLPVLLVAVLLVTLPCSAESEADPQTLSLEDILNLKIVSASKKSENIFDAPLSASIITREDIIASGATSIQEALRLVPGAIVRQQTNGNYDIHLRGFDGMPQREFFTPWANSTTLVMIDNRVVYSYFQGGTFWETLPIGIADIDRIEVIRGPSSAMYGPNAVNGVINIITQKVETTGIPAKLSAFAGNGGLRTGTFSVGYRGENAKWNARVSGNASMWNRSQKSYYRYALDEWVNDVAQTSYQTMWAFPRYPKQDRALEQGGLNGFFNYAPDEKVAIDVQTGLQYSFNQRIYFENLETPLNSFRSRTQYIDFKAKTYELSSHFSLQRGRQEGLIDFVYDFSTYDADVEYEMTFGALSVRPGIAGRLAVYKGDYIGGQRELGNLGLFVRSEYSTHNWRFVAALRGDKYNHPDKAYASWQLAATRKLSDSHLVRAVYSRSNKAPAFAEAYVDILSLSPTPVPNLFINRFFRGNLNLEMQYEDLFELGYRAQFGKNFQLDSELFLAYVNNIGGIADATMGEFITVAPGITLPQNVYLNIVPRASAREIGWTNSLNYVFNSKLQNKLYFTLQTSRLTQDNVTTHHRHTPMLFGGFVTDYQPIERLRLNLNTYLMTAQATTPRYGLGNAIDPAFIGNEGNVAFPPREVKIPTKLLVNLAASYKVAPAITIFASGRNILNRRAKEYVYADDVGATYFAGVSSEF